MRPKYFVKYQDGTYAHYNSHEEALAAVAKKYPTFHWEQSGDKTLIWPSKLDSYDLEQRPVATIKEV